MLFGSVFNSYFTTSETIQNSSVFFNKNHYRLNEDIGLLVSSMVTKWDFDLSQDGIEATCASWVRGLILVKEKFLLIKFQKKNFGYNFFNIKAVDDMIDREPAT